MGRSSLNSSYNFSAEMIKKKMNIDLERNIHDCHGSFASWDYRVGGVFLSFLKSVQPLTFCNMKLDFST